MRPENDTAAVLSCVENLGLVDHHCHGVVRRGLDRADFEAMLTEAGAPPPPGVTLFDSSIGFAVRRWCAPLLDLPAHTAPEDYLARREELGAGEVNRRFLRGARLSAVCVDTGYLPEPITGPADTGSLAGAEAYEVVRLERVAEEVAAEGAGAAEFADAVRTRLAERCRGAVAVKSIAAYRVGLALRAERPTEVEVAIAAGRWLSGLARGGPARLADETLHRFLVWCGVEVGLPIQFHAGYGDADVDLHRCDPLLLTPLLRAIRPTGTPVALLHNYPFHRHAGYLAQVFPHVFMDVGLATHNLGDRASTLIAEALELAPAGKFLYSSDAFGLPELYHLGALLFRRGLSAFLRSGMEEGSWTLADAERIARLAGRDNARRLYRLRERAEGRGPELPDGLEAPQARELEAG